ncbi:YegP family protein [Chitinophaga sp. CC14]|uniref:YegP family protein n=1 Tax=Chitinophaga sp. CC14 TaxID=3029199 RepID=UPI003B75D8E0
MGKFIIKTAKDGQNYFVLKAGNGEAILSSEMYTTKAACNNGIESVKTNAPNDSRYEKLTAKNGQFYFTLKAGNSQVIGTSEMYTTSSSRDGGIESVKSNAPGASVTEE